jgi:hypothetical protein
MQKPKLLLLASVAVICSMAIPAFADAPPQRGVIRQVDLRQGWVVIDTQRLFITDNTRIRNLAVGGNNRRALKVDFPVRFRKGENFELESIWVYPTDPEARGLLGYGTTVEEGP